MQLNALRLEIAAISRHTPSYTGGLESDFDGRDAHMNAPIVLEEDVRIGANAIILQGVVVGAGSIVFAGAVEAKSTPPGEVWGGVAV